MLHLAAVTLVIYDPVAHDLAALAVESCLRQAHFGAVQVWTDQPERFPDSVTHFHVDPSLPKDAGQSVLWNRLHSTLATSHVLNIEWDSGIVYPDAWTDEFLSYDYIGAVWPWHRELRVGNGGFALVSRQLLEFVARRPGEFPYAFPWDNTLCRVHRPKLEDHGFRWAPDEIAHRFSLEHGPARRTFGFHDCRNFPRLLSPAALSRRIAAANEFVCSHPAWKQMLWMIERGLALG